jgi:hypothetical protein
MVSYASKEGITSPSFGSLLSVIRLKQYGIYKRYGFKREFVVNLL